MFWARQHHATSVPFPAAIKQPMRRNDDGSLSRADNLVPVNGRRSLRPTMPRDHGRRRNLVAVLDELADHAVGHRADAPGTRDRQVIDIPVQPESFGGRGTVGVAKIALRKKNANLVG